MAAGPGKAQERPAITGIAFARFYTSDPAAAQRFYGGSLGFERHEVGGLWVYPVNRLQWLEILPEKPPTPSARMAAVAFMTRDAAGLERYVEAHGVAVTEPLHEGQFGVRDPEGNLVEFVQSAAPRGVAKLVADAGQSPRATSERIIHVGFIVVDAAREDSFWRGILGFKPYWHGGSGNVAGETDYISLQVPDGTDWLEYMLHGSPDSNLRDHGMSDHFSLGVVTIQDAKSKLAANDCQGADCAKTQLGRDGKMQLNVFDPDLTRVEFMEFKPVQEPCCSPFLGPHPTAVENK